jgi:hypothetical protein
MKKVSHTPGAVPLAVASLLGLAVLVAGCGPDQGAAVTPLPDAPRLVGGGIMIAWQAPEPGTAYLVEKQTGKIVETRSLAEGETYSFAATSVVQADEFEQMLGIPFGRAQFLLYFEPAAEAGETAVVRQSARGWSGF